MARTKKITKETIEEMVNKIVSFLKENELADDICIYYNDKRRSIDYKGDKIVAGINPHDYFNCADKHIISMSFEGGLYDLLNYAFGDTAEEFRTLLDGYGIYYELYDAWNLSYYPDDGSYDGIEYTDYTTEPEPEPIDVWRLDAVPTDIQKVMILWQAAVRIYGTCGSCIIGDGVYFKYKDTPYFMSTNYNQSDSVDTVIDIVKGALEHIGATEIRYDCGHMD